MKRAIVNGANGFIGSAVVKYLISQGVEVVALHRENSSFNIPENNLVKKMVMNLESIKNMQSKIPFEKYDTFYHFAWAGVSGDNRSSVDVQLRNIQWTLEALKMAKILGCKKFIGAGTIMEDETIAACYTQGNRPGLGYIYGGGKISAHVMGMSMAVKLGINFIWTKITNAYGIGEISPRMINTTIRKCIKGEPPEFTSAVQNYDFVYIDDVAKAFYLIGEKGKPFCEYLIGSSFARPLKEFLLEMKKIIAPDLDFRFGKVPFTGINLPLNAFDCGLTERDTGFKAKTSFSEGIMKTKKWLESVGNIENRK